MKKALITGITGQDGSYLAEFLLNKGYEVHGTLRRSSSFNSSRIDHIFNDIKTHYSDLTDSTSIAKLISTIEPDEIYNLGAQSHVKVSFEIPEYTSQVDAIGTLRILEAIRSKENLSSATKFYQASTSELYGLVQETPQKESTPFYPRSPYGVAKLYGFWIVKNYREAYNLHASSGILFNHESPRRGPTFVTKKITNGFEQILNGSIQYLELGNLNSLRDWGHAKDFVEAMWLMLQQDKADDYVISTGKQYSVREFCEKVAAYHDIDLVWNGEGLNEVGINKKTNTEIIKVNPNYFRPTEVESLLGDCSKAKKILGWSPKISFDELVEDMCKNKF